MRLRRPVREKLPADSLFHGDAVAVPPFFRDHGPAVGAVARVPPAVVPMMVTMVRADLSADVLRAGRGRRDRCEREQSSGSDEKLLHDVHLWLGQIGL